MQRAFYFDQTRCIGCFTCCVACKDWHDIPAGPAHWRKIIPFEEGKYPQPFLAYLATTCYHCEEPLCAVVCPAEAISKRNEDGIVVVDRGKCQEKARCGITVSDIGWQANFTACEITCPARVDVPGYIALIAKGRFKEALDLMREKLALPGVLGRVCSHPCESECKRSELDEPLAIRDLKRFAYDAVVDEKPIPLPRTKDQRVAVIGSGPAGLSAAYDLVRKGYGVTIFEALAVTGGMLAVGIPSYRLPREVLSRDIEYLKALGIEIRTKTPVGQGMTLADISHQGYEAIFIAVGAHYGRKLALPGSNAKNVLVGSSFLRDVNLGKPPKLGAKVLVLGGGNIAIDCARVALRLGAQKVEIACLESSNNMPALAADVSEAVKEGIVIHPSVTFKSIVCRDEQACGIECLKLRSMKFDNNGELHIDAINGTEHILAADTLIFAIGQSPELASLLAGTNIKTTRRGTIAIDAETTATSQAGVFAGGDAVTGTAWVIDAVAAGQRAAYHIDLYLRGEVLKKSVGETHIRASDIQIEIPPNLIKEARQEMTVRNMQERVSNFSEIALDYDAEQALKEAQRCLNCAGRLCLRVCPYHAPQFGAENGAKMQKCDFCLDRLAENKKPTCVDACIMRALDAGPIEQLKAKYGDIQKAVGFNYSPETRPAIVFKPKQRRRNEPEQ